ncbi:MAG: EpsG family protein [Paludibacteraceae bacterium]|nr:EpsG family protein [Paludibacteraceae bacterium]
MMFQLQTILVYTLLAIIMYIFAQKASLTQRASYHIVPIIAFILVFGLRYSVGIDWENYRAIYEEELYGLSFSEMLETRYEVGFLFIIYLCHLFQLPTYMLFVCIAAIQIIFLYLALKEEHGILPYVYLAFILSGIAIQGFCNVMRQDIAFCIFLYALKYVKKDKIIKYFLLCALALCFHKSAVILFPICFLWVRKNSFFSNQSIQCILFLACVFLPFLNPVEYILNISNDLIVAVGYEDYIESTLDLTTNNKIGLTRIIMIIAHLTIILNSKNIKAFYDNNMVNKIYDLYFIGICCYFLFLGNMMFGRITLYFTNIAFIMNGYALHYLIQQSKTVKHLAILSIISLTLLTSYASMLYNCTKNTDAYVSYFQEELHVIKDNQRSNMFDTRP